MGVGRPRNQSGYLGKRGIRTPGWFGEWYVYEDGKRVKFTQSLGRCDEVSRAQARLRLRELIVSTQHTTHALDTIGRTSKITIPSVVKGIAVQKTGAMSELLVCADLMAKGWDVYRATDPACACDLMVFKEGKSARIEVKTKTEYHLHLENKIGKFDVLAMVDRDGAAIHYYGYHELGDLKHPTFTIREQSCELLPLVAHQDPNNKGGM